MSPRSRLGSLALALLALVALLAPLALPAPVRAATRTLSALGPKHGWVSEVLVRNGRALYVADYEVEGHRELYSTPLDGGASLRLSADLPRGEAEDIELAGDLVVVCYVLYSTGQRALYSIPVAGGPAIKLTPDYATRSLGTGFFDFAVAGDRVVYMANQERSTVPMLYSAPVTGGPAVRLSVDLPSVLTRCSTGCHLAPSRPPSCSTARAPLLAM